MPSTYELITADILTTTAASVTFSAIPATYTDLVLRYFAKQNAGGQQYIVITLNGDTSTVYSDTSLNGNGSAASSSRDSNAAPTGIFGSVLGGTGDDGFNSGEIYIPSYTANQNKPLSMINVTEDNATAANIDAVALLYRSTSAITSIEFKPGANSLVSGSSFYLYGISNS